MSFVDLHLHSTASDGTTSPTEVVREAARQGVGGISLTDHDTTDGLEEASHEAAKAGIEFLPGAELSANEPGLSVHILAYGFRLDAPGIRRFFADYREARNLRARRIVERLQGLNVAIELGDVMNEAGDGVVTRAHIGRALVRVGAVPDQQTVFRRYLSRGGPAFVEKPPTPPGQVFSMVREAGGVTVLAHPGRTHRAGVIRRWAAEGLNGVEVLHPVNPPDVRHRLASLATELGLLRAGGSDWHGPDSARAELGSEQVPGEWMEQIADAARALQDEQERASAAC